MKYLASFVSLFAFLALFNTGLTAQQLTTTQAPVPCVDRTFTIVAHMVRDTFGDPNVTQAEIEDAIATLNDDFERMCVRFEVCDFRFINNFQYDNIDDGTELNEMFAYYNEESRINMYFVTSSDQPYCGVATLEGITGMAPNPGIAILKGDCLSPGSKTVSHEMGHFFGLLHTFEGSDGPNPELVDGSNCTTAGDLVCDTPADPYVEGDAPADYVDPDTDCRFTRPIRDGNGDWFVPDVGNIMAYYQTECSCGFTWGQYVRMANTYLNSPRGNW